MGGGGEGEHDCGVRPRGPRASLCIISSCKHSGILHHCFFASAAATPTPLHLHCNPPRPVQTHLGSQSRHLSQALLQTLLSMVNTRRPVERSDASCRRSMVPPKLAVYLRVNQSEARLATRSGRHDDAFPAFQPVHCTISAGQHCCALFHAGFLHQTIGSGRDFT